LQDSVAKKMAPTPVKLRADFEVTCFTYEGIDAIKEALLTARSQVNDETFQIAVLLILLIILYSSK
jgi:translation initiation factor 2 subunit 1